MNNNDRQPFSWVNEHSKTFLKRGYLRNGQEVEERVKEIADRAEEITGIEGFSDKFYDYMSKGYYSLSSPVWSNYGTKRGLPVSCFNSHIDDNMQSILYTLSEVGMLSKFGGGTSGYIGDIRPRGSEITNNGTSFGSVHFMELFDTLTSVVSQGSVRRGFFTPYLPIEHADYEEFVGIGSDGHPIQNLTHGVTVTDDFLKKLKAKDKDAATKWAKIIEARGEVGYPYIFFKDTVNRYTVDVYKDKGMEVKSSNMCLVGETKIMIKYQDEEVEETLESFNEKYNMGFYKEPVYVMSQNINTKENEWKEVTMSAHTDTVEELYIIEHEGKEVRCTGNHMLYTKNRGYVRADELQESDELVLL